MTKMITITLENGKTMEAATPQDAIKTLDALVRKRAAKRKYYQSHKKECMEANKRWLKTRPDYIRKWQKANPDKLRTYQKKWAAANPEKVKAYQRMANARRKLREEAKKIGMVATVLPKTKVQTVTNE